MRKSRKEAAETRQRIITAASMEFRRNGIDRTGLAELMAAAGLTHGGFYKHFESKEQATAESVAAGIESMIDSWRRTLADAPSDQGIRAPITEYLSANHRDEPATGCPFSALGSEVARSGEQVRQAATAGFLEMVDLIAGQLRGKSAAAARKEAMWMFPAMVGALTLARVVTDPEVSSSILRETRKHLISSLEAASKG